MKHSPIVAAGLAPLALTVEHKPFAAAAAFLARNVVERRNSIPILSNVVLSRAECGGLELMATDLDMVGRLTLPAGSVAFGDVPGAFTVNASMLADVCRKADGHTLAIRAEAGKAVFAIGRTRNTLATMPGDDFPVLRQPLASPGAAVFTISGDMLALDLARIAFAMSKEETRYYLNGVALQRREVGGRMAFVLVATDGCRMARVARDIPTGAEDLPDIILPRKLVGVLQKALKTRPGADVGFLVEPGHNSIAIMIGDDLYLVAKLIAGTFPNWQLVDPVPGAGLELQRLAFVDLEPLLKPADFAAFAKVLDGVPDVAMGETLFHFTSPTAPEFSGVASMLNPDHAGGNGPEYATPDTRAAADYLLDLARKRDLDPDAFTYTPEEKEYAPSAILPLHLHVRRGMVIGATFGRLIHGHSVNVEEPCYETFTMKTVTRTVPDSYQEGSFSVVMPREHAGMAAAVTFGTPGVDETSLRTLSSGALELDAAAVRRLAGDVSGLPRVDIPRFTMLHGKILAVDGLATDGTGRCVVDVEPVKGAKNPRRMTDHQALAAYCADPAATVEALRPRYYRAPDDAEPEEPQDAPVAETGTPEPAPLETRLAAVAVVLADGVEDAGENVIPVDFAASSALRDALAAEPAPEPGSLGARVAALEEALERLTLATPAAAIISEPSNEAPEIIALPDVAELQEERRDEARDEEMERLRLQFEMMAGELAAMTARAEKAEGALWQAENRLRGAERRAAGQARVAGERRKEAKRAKGELQAARAEAAALDRRLSAVMTALAPTRPADPPPSTGTMAVAFANAGSGR